MNSQFARLHTVSDWPIGIFVPNILCSYMDVQPFAGTKNTTGPSSSWKCWTVPLLGHVTSSWTHLLEQLMLSLSLFLWGWCFSSWLWNGFPVIELKEAESRSDYGTLTASCCADGSDSSPSVLTAVVSFYQNLFASLSTLVLFHATPECQFPDTISQMPYSL